MNKGEKRGKRKEVEACSLGQTKNRGEGARKTQAFDGRRITMRKK